MTESTTSSMETAKAAMDRKDWETARRELAPLVAENPHGVGAFHLGRTEFELGRPDVAAPLVAAFRAWRPKHVGARVLLARAHLANGHLDDAESEARAALDLDPERSAVPRLLDRIAAARRIADLDQFIDLLDKGANDAKVGAPGRDLMYAAEQLRHVDPGQGWARDPRRARVAYFHFAADLESALRNYDPHLIDISAEFDYIVWPQRIQEYVRGKSVLDVGCGFGGFGMGFLIAGARSYVGLDPAMELDSSRARNKRLRTWADMGITCRGIAEKLPAIRLFQNSCEHQSFDETFDTITLHNVTEHLVDPEAVIASLPRLCRPDTDVIFHHHNYFCWNGHHMAPNQPENLDESNPKHRDIYDWRHINLLPELAPDHFLKTNLNRIRLDELRKITEKYFHIQRWEEIPSSESTLERLTPEVIDRVRQVVPDLTERELSVNRVLAVLQPRI